MRIFIRISCTLFLALFGGAIASLISSELVTQVYMYENNITDRIELSEDYGLGTLTLFSAFLGFVVGVGLGVKPSWNITKRLA